ncbi:MAG: galactose ABC transporter substrate-binding protein [Oscillospiraceae bacterium]|nr:galactose ABC transporter substrate-binding protein [Oscillospiraceae bacterium]
MKKLISIAVALLLLATMTSAFAAEEPIKVGVCIYKFDDTFMTIYREELGKYLEEKGAVVTFMDGKGDQAEQTNQIQTYISQGVDVLIVNFVDPTAADAIIPLCEEAGIPLVLINREPYIDNPERWNEVWDKVTYVGADARQSGTIQGQIVLDLEDKGDINGDGIVSYIMLQGDMANVDAQYRTEFSIKALTDAGIVVDKLFEQRGEWQKSLGQELTATALAQFGDKIEVVFANNDDMAVGALQSIKDAGRIVGKDIYLLGVDANPDAVELVNAGEMTGTVLNDAVGQSHKAADVALEIVGGLIPERVYTVDYLKVVKE